MISVVLGNPADAGSRSRGVLILPVIDGPEGRSATPPSECSEEVFDVLADSPLAARAGHLERISRPRLDPSKILLLGVGSGDAAGWRRAGGSLARAARDASVTIEVPSERVIPFAEGLWLGEYRYLLREAKPEETVALREVHVTAAGDQGGLRERLEAARIVAEEVSFARDLTNAPSLTKTPAWFVDQVRGRGVPGVDLSVLEPEQLAEEGFGGIMAVGGGSDRGPRLLQVVWAPEGARTHVVLVGKGITYDTGGIDIKPVEYMQLMRKDMGGAATVVAATLAAAQLGLPVKVTALAPLAENMLSGSAWRPGDVVRHYGGLTSEVHSTDAEGRVVLADAMAYAVAKLEPDLMLDLATLTGASRIALGLRTAALFGDNDDLVKSIEEAAAQAGELVWRLPLPDDYLKEVVADVADLNNAAGNPGAITAALYLREFAGALRDRWAHIDMSAPSWSGDGDGELGKGATGWGVRTIVNWLASGVDAIA